MNSLPGTAYKNYDGDLLRSGDHTPERCLL